MTEKKFPKNPLQVRTARFKPLEIIHNSEGFVLARGIWDDKEMGLACRWHSETEVGYPNSRGYPQWFNMMGVVTNVAMDTTTMAKGCYQKKVTLELNSMVKSPYVLSEKEFLEIILGQLVTEYEPERKIKLGYVNTRVIINDGSQPLSGIYRLKPYILDHSNIYVEMEDGSIKTFKSNAIPFTIEIPIERFKELGGFHFVKWLNP